jgi:hypothetical protein
MRRSQFFHRRRHFSSHEKLRSTIHRLGITFEYMKLAAFDYLNFGFQRLFYRLLELFALIPAVGQDRFDRWLFISPKP